MKIYFTIRFGGEIPPCIDTSELPGKTLAKLKALPRHLKLYHKIRQVLNAPECEMTNIEVKED